MQLRDAEVHDTDSDLEMRQEIDLSPEAIEKLNAELLSLTTEIEALWSTFLDCIRGRSIKIRDTNDALLEASKHLMRFFEDPDSRCLHGYIRMDILERATEEYWMACELVYKVIK